ncbi:MAG: hypothetical protein KKI15_15805 [Proteobacteria bacterium]|nr:hypothetical protein [Pseudomonadota bacterium]
MKIIYTAVTVLFLSWFITCSTLAGELQPLYPGYPEVFDVQGSLDMIDENRVIINDLSYELRASTSFHTPKGSTSLAAFSERDQVGALLVSEAMEIKSLWLIKSAAPVVKEKREEEKPSILTRDNGVWKN